jgi:hypothetical protein
MSQGLCYHAKPPYRINQEIKEGISTWDSINVALNIWKRATTFPLKLSVKIVKYDLIFGVLMPLSTIFLLYHGDQF